MDADAALFAVFFTGLLGGVHCMGMCGGIVGALSMLGEQTQSVNTIRPVSSPIVNSFVIRMNGNIPVSLSNSSGFSLMKSGVCSRVSTPLFYNLGRVGMYTVLGFLAGSLGSLSFLLERAFPVQQFSYLVSSILLILMGVYLAGIRRIAVAVESIGKPLWKLVKPCASGRLRKRGFGNLIVTGALWGLVPCGMVYGVLTMALFAGDGVNGSLLMFAFGLGTLPNLLLLGVAGITLKRVTSRLWVRRTVGTVIVMFGVLGLLRLDKIAAQVNDLPLLRDLCRVIN